MKIIERKHLNYYDARMLAIHENWFTLADCETYEKWLISCDACENLKPIDFYTLAKIVYDYSDLPLKTEYREIECIENIMFVIANKAITTFEIENN